ncbi:MAG: hypothetical protein ACREJC_03160 [Tepidisphaeraceae bacterium]
MNAHHTTTCEALVFALDDSTERVGRELVRVAGDESGPLDWPLLVVSGAGEALRVVIQREPGAVFVCVGLEPLETAASVIDTLHRRRPRVPLLAITDEHDDCIERAVRAAGVGYYYPLCAASDERLLRRTLQALGVIASVRASHSGLSPPPVPRSRGSPRFSFRSLVNPENR